jgi:hypothetical protein
MAPTLGFGTIFGAGINPRRKLLQNYFKLRVIRRHGLGIICSCPIVFYNGMFPFYKMSRIGR